jgi:tRNA threonylcarbamoyladenosine biosynthesis protein TsaB
MSNSGLVLALDNSLDFLNLALVRDGRLVEERRMQAESRSSELFPVRISRLLKDHQYAPKDLSALVVTLGPGSFTGVRVALAFCKGLSEGLKIPLIGVATPDVLVAPFAFMEAHYLCPMIDAKKGEVFFGLYQVLAGQITRVGDIRASKPEDLLSQIKLPCLSFGTGVDMCRTALGGIEGLRLVDGFQQVSGETLFRCGFARLEAGCSEEARPIYGRKSEAEIKFGIEVS